MAANSKASTTRSRKGPSSAFSANKKWICFPTAHRAKRCRTSFSACSSWSVPMAATVQCSFSAFNALLDRLNVPLVRAVRSSTRQYRPDSSPAGRGEQFDPHPLRTCSAKIANPNPQFVPMGFHVANQTSVDLDVRGVLEIPARRLLETCARRRRSGSVSEVLHEIVADGFVVPQVLQLPLQTRAPIHCAGRVTAFAGCLDLAERKAVAVVIDPECNQIDARKAGPTFSFVPRVRPKEGARSVVGDVGLGRRLAKPPVFELVRTFQQATYPVLGEVRLRQSHKDSFETRPAFIVEKHGCDSIVQCVDQFAPRPSNAGP